MIVRAALLLLPGLMGPALPLVAQGLFYEGGLSVASGVFIFAERTTGWSLSTGLAAGTRRLTFRATLPVYLQNTSLVSLSGPGGAIPTGGSSSGVVADSGAARKGRGGAGGAAGASGMSTRLAQSAVEVPSSALTGYRAAVGDPTVEVSWRAVDAYRTGVTISLLAKAPVADTATFGTGRWDVASRVGLAQRVSRRLTAGLEVAYWHLGDLTTLDFRDPIYGTASVGYRGDGGWGGGLTFSAGSSALDGYDGPVWIGGHASRGSAGGGWGINGAVGLSETTLDFTLALSWRVRLLRGP